MGSGAPTSRQCLYRSINYIHVHLPSYQVILLCCSLLQLVESWIEKEETKGR